MAKAQQLRKLLENVEQLFRHRYVQYPMMIQEEWETREDLEAKIERWKAGEQVQGIFGEYEGGEVGIRRPFQFVKPTVRKDSEKPA